MMSPPTLSVSRLVALLKETVEDNFLQVAVEGEISNFSMPASGHFYLTLKDEFAQLRGVMFRPQNRLLRFRPENGLQVICCGRLSIYPQRGEVQLVIDSMEPTGLGGLQLAFEQLKVRLASEGLFAEERKRPLPAFPETVGIVTSASGAAIHDILQVLRRRGPGVRVLLCPVKVQGEEAAVEIAQAIADLNRQGDADLIIVGRGGGSLEDLWAFNEEAVARAIYSSRIPVISAVGHEVDVSIADFVADLRAPTPSAAAEMVVKSRLELENHIDQLIFHLCTLLRARLALYGERVEGLRRHLRSPVQLLQLHRERVQNLGSRLEQAMRRRLERADEGLRAAVGTLDAFSPLRTLERGYAIVRELRDGRVVRDAAQLAAGDRVELLFARSRVRATVDGGES